MSKASDARDLMVFLDSLSRGKPMMKKKLHWTILSTTNIYTVPDLVIVMGTVEGLVVVILEAKRVELQLISSHLSKLDQIFRCEVYETSFSNFFDACLDGETNKASCRESPIVQASLKKKMRHNF